MGGPVIQRLPDHRQHSIKIVDHIIVPEPQYDIPLRIKKSRAPGIVFSIHSMLPAIDLYYQSLFSRNEVANELTDWKLAVEADATQFAGA